MLEALLKGLGIGFYLSLSVGPLIFAIIKISLRYGHKAGYAFVAGVSLSDVTLVMFGNFAATFVKRLLTYEKTIELLGGLLLITIGLMTILKKDSKVGDDHGISNKIASYNFYRIFFQGFFMNILNPGPIIIWLGWCTWAANNEMSVADRVIMFGTCLVFVLATDIAKVLLAGKLREKLTQKRLHKINVFSALILLGFGMFLLGKFLVEVPSVKHWLKLG
jgi:threonine/homoserine/homoserine lactone efflux protein